MSSRVPRPAASQEGQSNRSQRRYDVAALRAVVPGRKFLMLLVLLSFMRAVAIPPCEMHLGTSTGATESESAALMAAAAHHHSSSKPVTEHGDEHNGACTCVGDCHPAAATPLASRSPALLFAATVTTDNAHRPAAPPSILPVTQAYILPFATAPPTHEV